MKRLTSAGVLIFLVACRSQTHPVPPIPRLPAVTRAVVLPPAPPAAVVRTNLISFWNRTDRYVIEGSTNLAEWYPLFPAFAGSFNEPNVWVWTSELVRTNFDREFFRMRIVP